MQSHVKSAAICFSAHQFLSINANHNQQIISQNNGKNWDTNSIWGNQKCSTRPEHQPIKGIGCAKIIGSCDNIVHDIGCTNCRLSLLVKACQWQHTPMKPISSKSIWIDGLSCNSENQSQIPELTKVPGLADIRFSWTNKDVPKIATSINCSCFKAQKAAKNTGIHDEKEPKPV